MPEAYIPPTSPVPLAPARRNVALPSESPSHPTPPHLLHILSLHVVHIQSLTRLLEPASFPPHPYNHAHAPDTDSCFDLQRCAIGSEDEVNMHSKVRLMGFNICKNHSLQGITCRHGLARWSGNVRDIHACIVDRRGPTPHGLLRNDSSVVQFVEPSDVQNPTSNSFQA